MTYQAHTITFFIYLNSVQGIIQMNENSTQEQIINCAVETANRNFNFIKHTIVFASNVDEIAVNNFLKIYKGTVVIEAKREAALPRQVVVIVDSVTTFMKLLLKLKPDLRGATLLNGGVKFLVAVLFKSQYLERITRALWNYHTTDVVIILNRKGKIALYTYYPYINHLNCYNTKPSLIGFWNENVTKSTILYPNKMRNMQGCPLFISTNKLYHPETDQHVALLVVKKTVVSLLREVMNFTPIVSSIDADPKKDWANSLTDVVSGVVNLSTCNVPLGKDKYGLLDYSLPYFRVRVAWLSPPISLGPPWWRLLSPLNSYLWLVLLVVVLIVKSIPFLMQVGPVKRFCYKYFRNVDKMQGVAFRTWGMMMGQPIRVAPRRFRDFYILSLWLWFTFVVRSAYQSVLIGALKADTIVGDFKELTEAIDKDYRIGGRISIHTHFVNDPFISKRLEIVSESDFEMVLSEVLEGKKFVLAVPVEDAWAYCLSRGLKENECGHVLPGSIMTESLAIWMKANSPFGRSLREWLPRILESGILDHKVVKKITSPAIKSSDPSALTLKQMISSLLCLFLGYVISSLVFAIEITVNRVNLYKKTHVIGKLSRH